MIVSDDDGWPSYRDLDNSLQVLTELLLTIPDIRTYITSQEAVYTIPPKSNTKEPWDCDWWLYKERHLVECFFNKIKHFRRVATRYDKLASSFYAFVYIAAIWLLSK